MVLGTLAMRIIQRFSLFPSMNKLEYNVCSYRYEEDCKKEDYLKPKVCVSLFCVFGCFCFTHRKGGKCNSIIPYMMLY